jgi:hypothetical protein
MSFIFMECMLSVFNSKDIGAAQYYSAISNVFSLTPSPRERVFDDGMLIYFNSSLVGFLPGLTPTPLQGRGAFGWMAKLF